METGSNAFVDASSAPEQAVKRARGSFSSHVITLATGAGVSEGVRVLGTLILARLIAPADFGFLALFVTVVSLVSVAGGARYELAIMLPEQDSEAANVAILAGLVGLGIALVSAVAVFALRHPLTKFFGDPRIAGWLWSVPVVLLLSALGEVGRYWFGRTKAFRLVAIAKVSQSVGVLGAQLGLWALHVSGGMALIGGWLIGQSVWTGAMTGCMIAKNGRFIARSFDYSRIFELAVKHKAFPIYRAPYSFIANGSSQLIFVILRAFCGLDVIGLYLLANRAIYFPVNLFGSSMGQVFYQKAASETKLQTLEPFVARLVRVQITFGVPILIFFAFEAPLLFRTFLGARWQMAGSFAAWLAFAGFLYLLDAWLVRLFDVCGRQRLALVLQVIGGGASLAALSLALYLGKNAIWGIAAFTLSEVGWSIVWLVFAYRISGFRMGNLIRMAKDFAIAALPIACIDYPIHHLFSAWMACTLMALVTTLALAVLCRKNGGLRLRPASTVDKFRRYWSDKPRPLHRDSTEFYEAYAAEVRRLFPARDLKRILEIGCGDGSTFAYFDLPLESYRGVDFSGHFLETFRSRYPQVDVRCAEGSSYVEQEFRFDVIFSNEVIQHFDPGMLDRHLQNASHMMHSDSVLILGSVPDAAHRRRFDSGSYSPLKEPLRRRYFRHLKETARRTLGPDCSGFWYTADEIAAVASRHGFRVRIVQSELQPSRFHAILSPDSAFSTVANAEQSARNAQIAVPSDGFRPSDHLPA